MKKAFIMTVVSLTLIATLFVACSTLEPTNSREIASANGRMIRLPMNWDEHFKKTHMKTQE